MNDGSPCLIIDTELQLNSTLSNPFYEAKATDFPLASDHYARQF